MSESSEFISPNERDKLPEAIKKELSKLTPERLAAQRGLVPASESDKREFWTERRVGRVKKLFDVINKELEKYGCEPEEFNPDNVLLFSSKKKNQKFIYGGFHNAFTNDIVINIGEKDVSSEYLARICHETLHRKSLKMAQPRKEKVYLRRLGIGMHRKRFSHSEGIVGGSRLEHKLLRSLKRFEARHQGVWPWSMDFLNEGIIQTTTNRILTKHFNDFSSTVRGTYNLNMGVVAEVCSALSKFNPETLPTGDDAFELFKQATYGRGRALELGRVFEKTFGKGAFYKMAGLVDAIEANKKSHSLTLFEDASDIPEYRRLVEFLSKPADQTANL